MNLETYRREIADYLAVENRVIDDTGRLLVSDRRYPGIDAYRREVTLYVYHLCLTMAAMDGDISPDEMLAMLFTGLGGVASTDEYFDTVASMQNDLMAHSEYLDQIPPFLDLAAAYDAENGTSLAFDLASSLRGMARAIMIADRHEDDSERLFLERYERLLDRFLERAGLPTLREG